MKRPVSALVVLHTPALDILLLERTGTPGFWQSVTGSLEEGEMPAAAAIREVREETGLQFSEVDLVDWRLSNRYEILPAWRNRYAANVTSNLEHVFSISVAPGQEVAIAPAEHRAFRWFPWETASGQCFSWSNRDAIRMLPHIALARR